MAISDQNSTLTEAIVDFLAALKPQDRETTQTEVYKFVRWFGIHRTVSELNPIDIAGYGDQVTPSAAKLVKSFLTYIHSRGFSKVNLSGHLRAKKPPSKATHFLKNSQGQIVLTAQGHAELEAELAKLKDQRSEATEEIRKAAVDKDFRENAPLHAARERKSRLEGRIQELESTLKSASIIDESQITPKVKIGDSIVLHDLSSGEDLCCLLVDPREASPIKNRLSTASPIGKVLLGKEKGQTIEVTAPVGVLRYCIKDIQQSH